MAAGPRSGRPSPEESRRTREKLNSLAWLLDNSIRLPGGFRIGLDALIGLVPFLGDAAGVVLSGYIVREAARLGAPTSLLIRMGLNVVIEGLIGMIPFLGDIFDAAWKANQRNVLLLGRHLDNPVSSTRSNRLFVALFLGGIFLFMALMTLLSALLMNWLWHRLTA